jgi:hypothetical protein
MLLVNKAGILLCVVVLSGCSSWVEKKACDICNTSKICHVKQPLNLGYPDPLDLNSIRGYVSNTEPKTVVLTLEEYKKLVLNNKKIENYISECINIIDETEKYYTSE